MQERLLPYTWAANAICSGNMTGKLGRTPKRQQAAIQNMADCEILTSKLVCQRDGFCTKDWKLQLSRLVANFVWGICRTTMISECD
jgi:hypothetical protein